MYGGYSLARSWESAAAGVLQLVESRFFSEISRMYSIFFEFF